MGKITGFLEVKRLQEASEPPANRLKHWKEFVPCLEECLDFLKKNPEENDKGDAALYGLSEKIPNKGVVGEFIIYYLESILDAL